ncbi:MAG TPA: hypothetical protein VFF06_03440 [Polyangia bacterium]|nr:hypothetical protein [Polyangia bacterium]
MARARGWLIVLLAAAGGCTEQRLELEQEKAKNRQLEQQVQLMQLQLDQARKQIDELKAKPAEAPVERSAAGDEKSLQDAQDAYVHGEYKKAIDLARSGIDHAPGRAWRVIGASHCFLKDTSEAREAWSHLDAQGKQFLKYVCSRSGVGL